MNSVLKRTEEILMADPLGMFKALFTLPDQCAEAWRLGMEAELPITGGKTDRVVVAGMGGSAIGGDLLRIYAQERLDAPVIVIRDYNLPRFVDDRTLVFSVSYSGNTEETLSSYEAARRKGAKIVAVTTGGKLMEMARRDGVAVITVPGGMSPRAATGYMFFPTLAVLFRMGMLRGTNKEVDETVSRLKSLRAGLIPEVPFESNRAKQLAEEIHDRVPVIWGVAGTTEVVAQRWKGQINENAKNLAYWNIIPELNHNELVGFGMPKDILKKVYIIILKDAGDHPRVQKRIEITKEIIGDLVAGIAEVNSSGEGLLTRLYSLIYFGDYTSVYLAVLNGGETTPVKVIDHLKARLSEN